MTNGRSFFVRFARCFDYEKQLNDLSFFRVILPTYQLYSTTTKHTNHKIPPRRRRRTMVLAAFANRSTWGVAMSLTSARTPITHGGQCRLRLVWRNSVGGTSSCYISSHHVNWGFFLCMVIINSPGLWCGYDPSDCTGAFATPWKALNLLGLVEFRRGDE